MTGAGIQGKEDIGEKSKFWLKSCTPATGNNHENDLAKQSL